MSYSITQGSRLFFPPFVHLQERFNSTPLELILFMQKFMKQSFMCPEISQYLFNFDVDIKLQLYKFMEGKCDKVKAREVKKSWTRSEKHETEQ